MHKNSVQTVTWMKLRGRNATCLAAENKHLSKVLMPEAFAHYRACDLICSELKQKSYLFLLWGNWLHSAAGLRLFGTVSSSANRETDTGCITFCTAAYLRAFYLLGSPVWGPEGWRKHHCTAGPWVTGMRSLSNACVCPTAVETLMEENLQKRGAR